MPYRFADGEATDQGIRRVATDQLDRAIRELTDGVGAEPPSAIHAARKALKKERSLLRLARGSIKPSTRRRENGVFRDAGRTLSGARDAEVVVHALDGLAERYVGQVPENTFATIRNHLSQSRQEPHEAVPREVVEQLEAARERARRWGLKDRDWKGVESGLRRSYRRGRRAFKRASGDPTTENLHEWRKRAKDHWYHLRLLRPIAPHTLKGQAKDAHRLSDLLGDDHDLALLRDALRRQAPALALDLDPVIALLEHRRCELQAQAMFLGRRLYAEKPNAFVRRMRAYWKAWRAQAPTSRGPQPLVS
jgi:CHAD domain-containing protein